MCMSKKERIHQRLFTMSPTLDIKKILCIYKYAQNTHMYVLFMKYVLRIK